MLTLRDTHPWLYQQFSENGFHAVRRSEKFWAGLWSDLIIEQTMMQSVKSRGGLTSGRGMTESVRLYWVSTMHHFASVHQAMSAVTKTLIQTSEQHVEIGNSRMRRDADDSQKVCNWFSQFNPFDTSDQRLCSFSSGLVAMPSDGIYLIQLVSIVTLLR